MVSSRRNHSSTGSVPHKIGDYAFVVNAIIRASGIQPNGGARHSAEWRRNGKEDFDRKRRFN
jgi:hypothetical protein